MGYGPAPAQDEPQWVCKLLSHIPISKFEVKKKTPRRWKQPPALLQVSREPEHEPFLQWHLSQTGLEMSYNQVLVVMPSVTY